jgi:Spy/CpxP family protein refolding chaperone
MKPYVLRWAGTALILVALACPAGAQGFAWWRSTEFQQDIGLTKDQYGRIDGEFESSLPRLRQLKEELDRQEAELSRMIEADMDEAQLTQQIDRVETTRAALNKGRTLMLVHMRQVLTPEQRVKFKAARGQWERDHRHPGRGGAPNQPDHQN